MNLDILMEAVATNPPPVQAGAESTENLRARYCARCNEPFGDYEQKARTGDFEYWHLKCFVCSHCFKPFDKDLLYYNFEGRMYCERDFRTLFAPCCSRCNKFIIGRRIKALNKSWHPNCLLCDQCQIPLADMGFVKNKDRALCHTCNLKEKAVEPIKKYTCHKCNQFIDEKVDGEPLRYNYETYHAYHFNCTSCGIELKSNSTREVRKDLYCLKCHDKLDGVAICGGCRRPIERQRIVTALGKQWHPEHFVCTACERPFLGKRHFEVKGLAYCDEHYHQQFGHQCCVCLKIVRGKVICALDKYYCQDHFSCSVCSNQLKVDKSKFYDLQSLPCCKKCFKRLPRSYRKQLAKQRDEEERMRMAS